MLEENLRKDDLYIETKICNRCNVEKSVNDFYKRRGKPDTICKECVKKKSRNYYYTHKNDEEFKRKKKEAKHIYDMERKKTFDGWASHLYNGMKYRNEKKFNLKLPFTLEEFKQWVKDNYGERFNKMFEEYIKNDCDKYLVPSVDRIDDYDSYHFENMQLLTWKQNDIKGSKSIKTKTNIAQIGKKYRSKTVIQMSESQEEIQKFSSTHEVERILGFDSSLIAKACREGFKSKGFYWKYEEKNK